MGTTGTASIKLLLCSLLLMNEQREGEEGAVSIRLLQGMGVASSGAAPCRDRQALPGSLSPAQVPSDARGLVTLGCSGWVTGQSWVGHRAPWVTHRLL